MRSGPFYHVRFANWNKLCFCITWQNTKVAFSLKWCISVLPEFNQVLDVFSLFDSRLILTLLYDFQNIAINSFSSGLLGAWLMRKEVESVAEVGLCCTHNAPVRCLLGFLFRKVTQKHYRDEVVKQSKTHLPKIVIIWSCNVKIIASQMWDVSWDTAYVHYRFQPNFT